METSQNAAPSRVWCPLDSGPTTLVGPETAFRASTIGPKDEPVDDSDMNPQDDDADTLHRRPRHDGDGDPGDRKVP